MVCKNPKVDLVNIKAYIKFGEILLICSQDIEQKRNFGINQGPQLWYKYAKNDVCESQARSCQYECRKKLGGKMSVSSQDIERVRNFGVN